PGAAAPAPAPDWTRVRAFRSLRGMRTAFLTRKVRFSAAHRYHRPEWSDDENRRVFGACNYPHGHGHNYLLEVTVRGEIDPETGISIDLSALDALLER